MSHLEVEERKFSYAYLRISFTYSIFLTSIKVVVTAHNNDEQYMRSKRERSRERDTQI